LAVARIISGGRIHPDSCCDPVADERLVRVGSHVPRRHQPRIVPKSFEPSTKMMCADTGLHTYQARRHVGETRLDLTTRPLLAQHHRAAIIKPNNVKRVLADMMPTMEIAVCVVAGMACSLSGRPWPVYRWWGRSTAGPSHCGSRALLGEGGNLTALPGVVDEARGIRPLPAARLRRHLAAAAIERCHGASGPAERRRWAP
jgi:hypothetical protein